MGDRRVLFIDELEALCLKHDLIFWDIGDGRSYGVASRQDVMEAAGGDSGKAAELLIRDPNWATLTIPAHRWIPDKNLAPPAPPKE